MVIGLSIFDADSLFTGVSMDGDGLDCIQFTPDFFFSGNPRIPAKDSWQCIYSHYQISMGLVIANTMCRKMVLDRGQVDRKMRKALLDAASEEGKELCQLDEDEVEQIFDKSFSYLVRVFSNPNIRNAIKAFAEELKTRRNLTNYEVEDLLHYLNIV
jgi:hypothetical protein